MEGKCPFCLQKDILKKNESAFLKWDSYPVSPGHVLIIPFRHVNSFFELSRQEKEDMFLLLEQAKLIIEEMYRPDGYNIGLNIGQAAGQTVMHVHIHIIPRYEGDMDDPRGGVRGVIPEKQKY